MKTSPRRAFFDRSNLGARFMDFTHTKLPKDVCDLFVERLPRIEEEELFLFVEERSFRGKGILAAAFANFCYTNRLGFYYAYLSDVTAARKSSWGGDAQEYETMKSAEFLVLDGFDTREPANIVVDTLDEIIRLRLRFGRHTVIISDLPMRGHKVRGFKRSFRRIGQVIESEFEQWSCRRG